jgi:hypothetical protein
MYRCVRERIITAELMKLERRQAAERSGQRARAATSSDRTTGGSSAASVAGTLARSRRIALHEARHRDSAFDHRAAAAGASPA